MAKKKKNPKDAKAKSKRPLAESESGELGQLRSIGGSYSDDWNRFVVAQVSQCVWLGHSDVKIAERDRSAALAALIGFEPRNELEGMFASQIIGIYNAMMECLRRAMHPEQPAQERQELLNLADKLSRTFASLVDSLKRYRGGNDQKIKVEHLHLHGPAPAAAENLSADKSLQIEGQSNATQITHAPSSKMRRADAQREKMPISRDAKWPLPDARRPITRRSKGK